MNEIIRTEMQPTQEVIGQRDINVATKVATATAMASATSFCLERTFLHDLQNNEYFKANIEQQGSGSLEDINWMSIQQIGRPAGDDMKSCFHALQNILHACSLPHTQLLFLVIGHNGHFKIYLGIHHDFDISVADAESFVREISSFANVSWPGLKTHVVDNEIVEKDVMPYLSNKYQNIYAVTGIPSLDLKDSNYPSTIEYLLGGVSAVGDIAYLVVANPVNENEVSKIEYELDEIKGQAESMKTITFNIAKTKGDSISYAETLSSALGKTKNDSASRRDIGGGIGVIGVGLGVAALTLLFPPAGAVAAAAAGTAGVTAAGVTAAGATAAAMLGTAAAGTLGTLVPQKTHGVSVQETETKSTTQTTSENSSYTETLGQTYVNGHIDTLLNDLKLQSERFRTGRSQGMWQVGCYLFTDANNVSSHLQLKSLLTGQNSKLETIRTHNISRVNNRYLAPFVVPPKLSVVSRKEDPQTQKHHVFQHPLGESFSSLTTYLTTEELTSMVNFPLHTVPGISVIDCPPEFRLDLPDISANSANVSLGDLLYRGDTCGIKCKFDLNTLVRHSLVCGSNGSGKTNTVLGILNEVLRHGKNFMVIEPAKTEYVDWAIKFNEQLELDQKDGKRLEEEAITIYMPGRKHYWHSNARGENEKYILKDVLKINPFEPVVLDDEEPNVQSHLDRIKSIFSLAFPMEDILPTVMEKLLTDVYSNGEKWLNRKEDGALPEKYPTLSLLQSKSKDVIAGLGYESRVTANITAAIDLRLSNLLSGWKRELFNNEVLGGYKKLSKTEIEQGIKRPTWDEFFNRRVVVNLSGIADDNDRVFVMGLLLLYLYEYRVATSERPGFSFNDETLKHLMVIEEAHRVMTKNSDPNSPQYKCGALFSQILSEIRAYGQGIMVVDQIPSRLIEDATKNTNMKIVHRLIAADDIDSVSSSMGVNDEQKRIFPKLTVGQAVIAGLNASMSESVGGEDIYWVKIKKNK